MIENIKKIVKALQGEIQTLYIDTNDNRRDKATRGARNNLDYLMTAVYQLARIPDEASTQIQDLIADNKRLRAENEWQPIETAPQCKRCNCPAELTNQKNEPFCKDCGEYLSDTKNKFIHSVLFYRSPKNGLTTHWRPIPQPPKEE